MKTSDKLIKYLLKNGATSIDVLATKLKISRQYVHTIVKEQIDRKSLIKMGTSPHVFYNIAPQLEKIDNELIPYNQEQFLQQHLLIVDALGNKLEGLNAMTYWCSNQQLPLRKTVEEFIKTREKYLAYYNHDNLIDGFPKLQNTKGIGVLGVDELYFLDFYAIERFGKTHLGCLMHYSKQGQNKNLMKIIVTEIKNRLQNFIVNHNIEAVVYVPPTIKRKIQIMHFIEKELNLSIPKISVKKISNEIVIPQKALSKIFERVANARNTFIVPEQKKYNKILILDDAIGSGATINEIALKIKTQKLAKVIIGLSITGSYKGFEVISEL